MTDTAGTEPDALLARHAPVLKYDSQEPYFATTVATWTDNPTNRLLRADGTVLATAGGTDAAPGDGAGGAAGTPQLSVAFLGAKTYADGTPARPDDRIADADHRDYPAQARAMHARPGYGDRVYGHAARGSDGRTWLSYWFFYFYNDYNLLAHLLPAGLHEGDWEMIQLRLNPAGSAPDLALYAEHSRARARDWTDVERVGPDGAQPVIYPARGSHACYFAAGTHWTGHWFEQANGRGRTVAPALEAIHDDDPADGWVHWPGRWGGTQPRPGLWARLGLDSTSPHGPGHQRQWKDPAKLLASVVE